MKTVIRNSYSPQLGDYCNTVVVDRESGIKYIFDADGVYTKFTCVKTITSLDDYREKYKDTDVFSTGPVKEKFDELDGEIGNLHETDAGLQQEIDDIRDHTDVVDIVGTYAELQAYDTSELGDNDIVKVLQDETRGGATTYYRWDKGDSTWEYIGEQGPFYTKTQTDDLLALKQDKLIAGNNIQINGATISATDTTYTAGAGLTLAGTEFSVDNTVALKSDLPTKTSDLENDGSGGSSPFVEVDDLSPAEISGEGATIQLEGTSDCAPLSLTHLYGNAEQQTYSGKNLVNINATPTVGHATTSVSGQSITVTTDAAATTARATFPLEYEANREMTISFDATCLTYEPTATNTVIVYMRTTGQSDATTQISLDRTVGTTTHYTRTFTPNNDTKDLWLYLKSSNIAGVVSYRFDNIQIEYGASETSYEKFVGGTPSPNPDYPQDVNVVTGEQTVKITGKNLFDIDKLAVTGITISDGTATGTASSFNSAFSSTGISLSLGEAQYTLSITGYTDGNQSTDGSGLGFRFGYTDGTYSSWTYWHNADLTLENKTMTTASGKTPNALYFTFASRGQNIWHLSNIQLELGNQATAYEPYQGQEYTIDLDTTELAKIGTYQDYIWNDGGTWKIHREVGKVVLDGTETWTGTGGGNGYRIEKSDIILTPANTLAPIMSNYFTTATFSSIYNATIDYGIANHNSNHWIALRDKNWTSASDVTTWLSTHPTTVYYALATPTDTEITDSELLGQLEAVAAAAAYNGVTNIFLIPSSGATGSLAVITYGDSPIPYATNLRAGVVRIGSGLAVDECGEISAETIEVDDQLSFLSSNPVTNEGITKSIYAQAVGESANGIDINDKTHAGGNGWYTNIGTLTDSTDAPRGAKSVAIGHSSASTGENSVAIGYGNTASALGSAAVGTFTIASGQHAVAVGSGAKATGESSSAYGRYAEANNSNDVAIGYSSKTKAGNTSAVAIGNMARAGGSGSVAIGTNVSASESATSTNTIAIGSSVYPTSDNSVAIGSGIYGPAASTVSIGQNAAAREAEGVAIGHSAIVNPSATNSVALGKSSVATDAGTISVGDGTAQTPFYRRIVNVADATAAHDAITKGQFDTAIGNVETILQTLNSGNGAQ